MYAFYMHQGSKNLSRGQRGKGEQHERYSASSNSIGDKVFYALATAMTNGPRHNASFAKPFFKGQVLFQKTMLTVSTGS